MDSRGYSRIEEGRSREEDRQRLMDSTEMLRDSSNQLRDAKRTALETEDIAVGVMSDLRLRSELVRSQREVISRTGNSLNEIDSNLSTARRTISSMARRAMANRMVLTAIAIAIGLAVLYILYRKVAG